MDKSIAKKLNKELTHSIVNYFALNQSDNTIKAIRKKLFLSLEAEVVLLERYSETPFSSYFSSALDSISHVAHNLNATELIKIADSLRATREIPLASRQEILKDFIQLFQTLRKKQF